MHTALSFDLIGEDVLITGAGPVGCLAAAVARHAGARHVVITDVNPSRLALAEKMGASLALDIRTMSLTDAMASLGMQEGFDVGLEMSGSPQALDGMIAAMRHGGGVGLLGFIEGAVSMSWEPVIFGGLTIKGIYGREMFETWYKMTAMIESGLDVTPVITHHFPVADYEEAFEIMRPGHSGKIILEWAVGRAPERRRTMFANDVRIRLQQAIETTRDEGLFKTEHPIEGAAGRLGQARGRAHGAQHVRQQLPWAVRRIRESSRPPREASKSGATACRRCASSAARRVCTRSWRQALSAFLGHRRHDPLFILLRCQRRAVRDAARTGGRRHQRRAQPRQHHRRHPAVQGPAATATRTATWPTWRRKLQEAQDARIRLIATDGVFSMDGIIAPLAAICDLADRYEALVMVDDSHAVGVLGADRAGHARTLRRSGPRRHRHRHAGQGARRGQRRLHQRPREIVELLRQRSRPYLFSNTLAPMIAAASLEALEDRAGLAGAPRAPAAQHAAFPDRHRGGRIHHQGGGAPDHSRHDGGGPRGSADGGWAAGAGSLRSRLLLPRRPQGRGAHPRPGVGSSRDSRSGLRRRAIRCCTRWAACRMSGRCRSSVEPLT